MTRILGIDPGLQCTGYAVLDAGPKQLLEAGVIRPEGGSDLALRLASLAESMTEILDQWKPAAIAVEQLSGASLLCPGLTVMGVKQDVGVYKS